MKPNEIKSITIKDQGTYGTCYAHACSRNFVRTLQILGIIKSKYNEQFYLLFLNYLTEIKDCDIGGSYTQLFILLDYLKNNYSHGIFLKIQPEKMKCYTNTGPLSPPRPFLNLEITDKSEFITKMTQIKDYLYIAKYEYIIDNQNKQNNYPSEAIIKLLNMRLQPYVSCKSFTTKSEVCYNTDSGHAVILRSWNNNRIEIKNSWGTEWGTNGNFIYNNITDIACKDKQNISIVFASLIFDYDILPIAYKINVDNIIKIFNNTNISYTIIKQDNYFTGQKKYGFFYKGRYDDIIRKDGIFEGEFLFGFRLKGKIIASDGTYYDGNWGRDENFIWDGIVIVEKLTYRYEGTYIGTTTGEYAFHGQGKKIEIDGSIYDGEWRNGEFINGKVKEIYPNGNIYEGDYNGIGIININGICYSATNNKGKVQWNEGNKIICQDNIFTEETVPDVPFIGRKETVPVVPFIGRKETVPTIPFIGRKETVPDIPFIGRKETVPDVPFIGRKETVPVVPFIGRKETVPDIPFIGRKETVPDIPFIGRKETVPTIPKITKKIYDNGNHYKGEWINNQCNGKGKLTYSNGSYYEGNWINNERNGKGKQRYNDSSYYEGDWINNERNGKGQQRYTDSSYYEGDWINNERNGTGKQIYSDGSYYEGNWRNNYFINGKGKQLYSDGSFYDGIWENSNFINGKVKLIINNNTTYEGNHNGIGIINSNGICYSATNNKGSLKWNNENIINCQINISTETVPLILSIEKTEILPTLPLIEKTEIIIDDILKIIKKTYSDGSYYEGEWINNHRNGKGRLIYSNGSYYEGDWINNERNGKGKQIYSDGSYYEGYWINNERNGKGKQIYSDGSFYEGNWINNERNGKGKQIYSDGSFYEGKWANGKFINGNGKKIYSDGGFYDGIWKNNNFINGKVKLIINNNTIYEGDHNGSGIININGTCYLATNVKGSLTWDYQKIINCNDKKYYNKYLKYKSKYFKLTNKIS
jgi:hypothetical protein